MQNANLLQKTEEKKRLIIAVIVKRFFTTLAKNFNFFLLCHRKNAFFPTPLLPCLQSFGQKIGIPAIFV